MTQQYTDRTGTWRQQPSGEWEYVPNSRAPRSGGDTGIPAHLHGQYLEPSEVVAGPNVTVDRTSVPGSVVIGADNAQGPSSHSDLLNLDADDHTQYLTVPRADALYPRTLHAHPQDVPDGGGDGYFLRKASSGSYDMEWVPVTPGDGGGLATSYGYYKHYKTNQSYPRGSWQTIKLGTTDNAYPSPRNNPQLHQFQISLSSPNSSKPKWCQFQYYQVQESDATGPSSPQMWFGGTQKMHWSHMFEHQGSTVRIMMYAEGSGTVTVEYIIVKMMSFVKP